MYLILVYIAKVKIPAADDPRARPSAVLVPMSEGGTTNGGSETAWSGATP